MANLSNFEVYTGAKDGTTQYGLGGQVVQSVADPFVNKNHHLFFDNYFSSIELLSSLLSKNTFCVETTQTKRKQWPHAQLNIAELKKDLSRGQSKSVTVKASNNGKEVECLLWMDKKCVPFVNTLTDPHCLPGTDLHLCPVGCFEEYHTNKRRTNRQQNS